MKEGTIGIEVKVATVVMAVLLLGCLSWAGWGRTAWMIYSAKNAVLQRAGVSDANFQDVRIGADRQTVCGQIAIAGGSYRHFMVDRVAPVIDPGHDDGSLQAILWNDYPKKCARPV